jgi:uncharacterized membrane protein
MSTEVRLLGERLISEGLDGLPGRERRLIANCAKRLMHGHAVHDPKLTLGQRLADRVASFGGSWTFIILFGCVLVSWALLNSWLLLRPFDPYPYIFLNLMLSMLAAIQAPIIMMSQNRQAERDRVRAELDYEVNLKAELEIAALHEKIDALRQQDLIGLLNAINAKLETKS